MKSEYVPPRAVWALLAGGQVTLTHDERIVESWRRFNHPIIEYTLVSFGVDQCSEPNCALPRGHDGLHVPLPVLWQEAGYTEGPWSVSSGVDEPRAVEAAAQAIYAENAAYPDDWHNENEADREAHRAEARAALKAALPFLSVSREPSPTETKLPCVLCNDTGRYRAPDDDQLGPGGWTTCVVCHGRSASSDPAVRVSPRAEDENWEAGYADAVSEVVEVLRVEGKGEGWMPDAFRFAADFIEQRFGPSPGSTS